MGAKQITIVIAARTEKKIENIPQCDQVKILNIHGKVLADALLHIDSALQAQLAIVLGSKCALFTRTHTSGEHTVCWQAVTDSIIDSGEAAKKVDEAVSADRHSLIFLDEEFLFSGNHHPGLTPWRCIYPPVQPTPLTELPSCFDQQGVFWLSWGTDKLDDIDTTIKKQWNIVMDDLIYASHAPYV